MCSRNFCGLIWSAVTVVMLVAAIATPWYFVQQKIELGTDPSTATEMCDLSTLYSWEVAYCSVGPANSTCQRYLQDTLCLDKNVYSWRDDAACKDGKCPERSQTYYVCLVLMLVSLFCAAVTALGFFIRFCCNDKGRSTIMVVLSNLGWLCLVAAAGYFAYKLPSSYQTDLGGTCPSDKAFPLSFGESECDKFWGTHSFSALQLVYSTLWGPLGWWVALATVPFYLLNACMTCTSPVRDSASIQQSGGPYQRYENAQSNFV